MPHRKKPSSRHIFPFLTLPAELRLQIYEAAFIAPCEVEASFRYPSPQPFLIPGAFLRTCRQVYNEARDMLYSRNTFHVGDRPGDANHGIVWLSRIGAYNASLIRSISMDIYKCKLASRLLPFLVFLFELRCAATNLQELGIWLGPKVRRLGQSHAEMLGREVERFSHLKNLTLGGNYGVGWVETLRAKFDDAGGNGCIELVDVDSPAWKERLGRRERWWQIIADQADMVRGLRSQKIVFGEGAVAGEWAEPRAREMWARKACNCSECRGNIAAHLTKRVESALNSRADIEMENRRLFCECSDCAWVRENGRRADQTLSCFEIHERVANGSLMRGRGGKFPVMVSREYAAAENPYPLAYEEWEPPEEPWNMPMSTNEVSLHALPETSISRPVKLMTNMQAEELGTSKGTSQTRYKLAGERTLRRERRRWYGRTP